MELPIIEIGVYMRCQFRTCNGVCERMCLKNKKIPHCFQHTNRKSLGKCANPECENGTNSSTGYCNKKCLGVTQQALSLRNSRLIIAHKNTEFKCHICNCTVKCRYTHEQGKKHKLRCMMAYPHLPPQFQSQFSTKIGEIEKIESEPIMKTSEIEKIDNRDKVAEIGRQDVTEYNRLDIIPIREKMLKQLKAVTTSLKNR